jgi:hypothetical protein
MKKICSTCKENLPVSCFYARKSAPSGLRTQCKACENKYRRDNIELIKVGLKKYYNANKDRIITHTNTFNKNRDSGLASIYWTIVRRCKYPSQHNYKWYGGKGIKVEWKSYKEFKLDMYDSYITHLNIYGHKQTTIDRIDSDKNYCKKNCRWATWDMQHYNRSKKGV